MSDNNINRIIWNHSQYREELVKVDEEKLTICFCGGILNRCDPVKSHYQTMEHHNGVVSILQQEWK